MRVEALKNYAGIVTAILAFIGYMAVMWNFTDVDLLEIIVVYMVFVFPLSYVVPLIVAGEDDDEDSDRTGA